METQVWVNPDRNNLILQARFGREYGQRLARLYRRVSVSFRFIQIVSGTAAFTLLLGEPSSNALAAAAGLLIAIVSAIDMVWAPSDLASQCARASEQWGQLDAASGLLTDKELAARVAELSALVLPTWESLRIPVFNELMRQMNRREEILPHGKMGQIAFWVC